MPVVIQDPTAPITIDELTQTHIDGKGTFDVLMRAMRAHLDEQFQSNRIRGPEYAQVYLSSLESVLQHSVAFLLQKDKTRLEADLLLLQREKLALEADLLLLQKDKLSAELLNLGVQKLILDEQKLNLADERLTGAKQRLKLDEEIALLQQKKITEVAQVSALNVDADSVIGRQKLLYDAQTKGFTRDAEQKAANILVDSWKVRRTTDDATAANSTNKLSDAEVGRAVDKLLTGVGA
jgi:hypothetical protein